LVQENCSSIPLQETPWRVSLPRALILRQLFSLHALAADRRSVSFTYIQRADLLGKIADALAANRDEYFRLSLLNLGATQADASFDVDGAIYTMKYYAKIGRRWQKGKC